MKRRSLQFRLIASYTSLLALTYVCTGVGVWLIVRHSITATVDKDLRARVRSFRAYLQAPDLGPGDTLKEELTEMAATAPAGTSYRIADSSGRWLYRSSGTSSWDLPVPRRQSLPEDGQGSSITLSGKRYRVLTAPVLIGVMQIAVPLEEFDEMLSQFTWTAVAFLPILLVVSACGGYWMSGRSLAPVREITRIAQAISAQNLEQRLPVDGPGDELDQLSITLNSMFARLEGAFRQMAQFTADASHELRTPAAIIRTTAELTLSRPRTQPEYEKALQRVLAESERTTELIEGLMALARNDLGRNAIQATPVDLAFLARETVVEMEVLADARSVTVETDLPARAEILAEASLIRRLLLILLDNAIKYTPAGGRVRLSLNKNKNSVVTIEDTGIGIGSEDLPHIFDRFYRAAKDRSRSTGGSGLGLSIAKWIAACHGAEITVESKLGAGSTFRVVFRDN